MAHYCGSPETLGILDQHLSDRQFMVAERYTAADIAVFAYVHCSEEGGFNLRKYPRVESWCRRVQQQHGYIAIDYNPA